MAVNQFICPCCGHAGRASEFAASPPEDECQRLQIEPLPGGLVYERDAEKLLGYAEGTLRRQIYDGRNFLPFTRRGNRRIYSLADLEKIKSVKSSHSISSGDGAGSRFHT